MPLTKTEGLLLSNDDLLEGLMENSSVACGLMLNLPIYQAQGDSIRVERVSKLGLGTDPTFMQGVNPDPVGSTDAVPDAALQARFEFKGLVQDVIFNEFSIFNQSSVNFLPDNQLTAAKVRLLHKLEDTAINGDQLINPAEFDGLRTLTSPSQTIQTNDTVNNSLDIMDIVRLMSMVKRDGGNMMLVTSRRGFVEMARTLMDHGIGFGPTLEEAFEGNFLTNPDFDTPMLSDAILGALEGPAGSWLSLQTALARLAPGFSAPIVGKRSLSIRKKKEFPQDPASQDPGTSPGGGGGGGGDDDDDDDDDDGKPPWVDPEPPKKPEGPKKPEPEDPYKDSPGSHYGEDENKPKDDENKTTEDEHKNYEDDENKPQDDENKTTEDEHKNYEDDENKPQDDENKPQDDSQTFGNAVVVISDKIGTNEMIGSFNDGTSLYCMNTGPTGVFGATPLGSEMQCRMALNPTLNQETYRMYTSFTMVSAREDALARLQFRPTSASL